MKETKSGSSTYMKGAALTGKGGDASERQIKRMTFPMPILGRIV